LKLDRIVDRPLENPSPVPVQIPIKKSNLSHGTSCDFSISIDIKKLITKR
jgi:hypothetical protein